MERCTSRWERLLRETLPYPGCRNIFTCCTCLPWEKGDGAASTARGMRRKEETSPDVDVGASGAPRGEGWELQCFHTQESQLWAQEFLTQGQPAQHSPNGGTSLPRAWGFCRDTSGTCWWKLLLPCFTPCPHLQGQGSQPTCKSCTRSLTKHLVPSLVWKNLQDQQLTLLNSLWLLFAAQDPVKKPCVGPGFPAGFQHSQLSFLAGNVHLGAQPSASAVIPEAFLSHWGWD